MPRTAKLATEMAQPPHREQRQPGCTSKWRNAFHPIKQFTIIELNG